MPVRIVTSVKSLGSHLKAVLHLTTLLVFCPATKFLHKLYEKLNCLGPVNANPDKFENATFLYPVWPSVHTETVFWNTKNGNGFDFKITGTSD